MRVLSLLPSLDPLRGGTQSGSVNMLLASQRAGVGNVVAVPERASAHTRSLALVQPLRRAGVVVETFPPLPRPAELADRWSASLPQVRWIARHVADHDAVHVHGIWGLGLLAGLAAARATSTPTAVTAHESLTAFDIDDSRSAGRRWQKLALKALYLRWTTLFVLTSALEAEDSLPSSAPQRTVPYPLVDERAPLPRLRPRGTERGLRVGFLGRFDPKKNLDVLIDALAELPDHVRLVIAGDGPADFVRGMRERAARRGVEARLEWLGFVSPDDRPRLLEGLDVLAMPSVFESFGMSAAEAMLHGVPVVVSERTGIAEVIRRHGGGVLTAPTAPAVAAAIGRLERDRGSLAELGAQGQAGVREDLGFAPVGQALRDAYTFACGAESAGGA